MDFKVKTTAPCYLAETADKAKEEIAKVVAEKLPTMIENMGSNTFVVGNEPTYPDFLFWETLQPLIWATDGQLLKDYPKIQEYNDAFKALPVLKDYMPTSPEQDKDFLAP